MKAKQCSWFHFCLLLIPLLLLTFFIPSPLHGRNLSTALDKVGPDQRYMETIPHIILENPGQVSPQASNERHSVLSPIEGGGSAPGNPYAIIRQTAPAFLSPGATARYEIALANYESITHTYQLTATLPAQLVYLPAAADPFTYDSTSHSLTWQGTLAPGKLDYLIEESSLSLPYLDLADFGVANLCDGFLDDGNLCDDVEVTFNLGVNGYSVNLYGEQLYQLTVSSNGLMLGQKGQNNGRNQWLPAGAVPNFTLAGLWRDNDLTRYGRWHAAILSNLVAGHDVFYAQWHDAPHAQDADLTARHAIAVVLSSPNVTLLDTTHALAGHVFFIYDNISDPGQTVTQGYTIGIEDRLGLRGATYAYAPCCAAAELPHGFPPSAGTTLHLRPALFGSDNDFQQLLSYEALVVGQVPETVANTVVVRSSSANAALAEGWATHYLSIRHLTYLPFLQIEETQP